MTASSGASGKRPRRESRPAGDLSVARIDRVNRSGKPASEYVSNQRRADASRTIGRSKDSKRLRAEKVIEVASRHRWPSDRPRILGRNSVRRICLRNS